MSRKSRTRRTTALPVSDRVGTGMETTRPMTRGRRALLWAIVVALPFGLLASTEAVLRVAGAGHELEPLFIPSPQQPVYLQANPRVVTRFFTDPARAPAVSIETAFFRARKTPGTLRVFVQGESSAAGFPYGLGASIAGALDRRLERSFPSREIEVVSTAMAAVNSYALVDFADEIIAQQPDAVLVYVGHNEYLGILGVGSSMRLAPSPWLTRAFLAVREWRLFQLMSAGYARLQAMPPPGGRPGDSLMARVASERSIPLNSKLYSRGLQQFSINLASLLQKYERAGIPVFIGTLASNERDQMPLGFLAGDEAGPAAASKTAYEAAQDAENAGQYVAARDGYAWARDLDPLRFRAPSAFNDLIAQTARAHGATVVDVHAAFTRGSANGLIGDSLMLEHVHPNLEGYFLLADAFFDALIARNLPGTPEVDVGDADARASMPVSAIDRFFGEYKVRRIKAGWPFKPVYEPPTLPAPGSEAERIAQDLYQERTSWPEAQERLRQHYRSTGDQSAYADVTAILADAFPFAASLQFETAAALITLGRAADAQRYSRRSTELEPRSVNAWLVHAHALLLTGRYDAGRVALQQVLGLEPGNVTARQVLADLDSKSPAR